MWFKYIPLAIKDYLFSVILGNNNIGVDKNIYRKNAIKMN